MKITYDQIKAKHPEPYEMDLVGRCAEVTKKAVNQGIDSHLQACFVPARGDAYTVRGSRLGCVVSSESLPVLLRRLTEMEEDVAGILAADILTGIGFDVETMCFEIVN